MDAKLVNANLVIRDGHVYAQISCGNTVSYRKLPDHLGNASEEALVEHMKTIIPEMMAEIKAIQKELG